MLVSIQVVRNKAVITRITEDLRQVKIAAELSYGNSGNYNFSLINQDENILANSEILLFEEYNSLFIKKANAETNIDTPPAACVLFNTIVGEFVTKIHSLCPCSSTTKLQ